MVFIAFIIAVSGMLEVPGMDTEVDARVSKSDLLPGETFSIIFDVSEPSGLFYFGTQVKFDADFIEFVSEEKGNFMEPGISVSGYLSPDRIGASASRTDVSEELRDGQILILNFRVKEGVENGSVTFEFLSSEASDVDGGLMEVEEIESIVVSITGDGDEGGNGDGSGDGDGDGDGPDDPDPDMDIEIVDHVLVQYQFERLSPLPSAAIADNRNSPFELAGGTYTYANTTGLGDAKALRATGWSGKEDGSQYWYTTLSTLGFSGLKINWLQWGSNTGPRDFALEGRVGDGDWESFNRFGFQIQSGQGAGALYTYGAYEMLWDRPEVTIRWAMETDTSIAGNQVTNAGTSLIANIQITGVAMDTTVQIIRPGDTNNDGVVDESDVLALGTYWLSGGPETTLKSMNWNRRAKQSWVPLSATYADANGDGVVDYKDLQPIGMFFGRSAVSGKRIPRNLFSEEYDMTNEMSVRYVVSMNTEMDITGVSGKVKLDGMESSEYNIRLTPIFETSLLSGSDEMLKWERVMSDGASFAWVRKGYMTPEQRISSSSLFEVRLESNMDYPLQGTFSIEDISVVTNDGSQVAVDDISVLAFYGTSTDTFAEQTPGKFILYPAYPNPFNPSTNIRWEMSEPGRVRVSLWDILGREVLVAANGFYSENSNTVKIDASGLASGVYMVRIDTDTQVFTRNITLVK